MKQTTILRSRFTRLALSATLTLTATLTAPAAMASESSGSRWVVVDTGSGWPLRYRTEPNTGPNSVIKGVLNDGADLEIFCNVRGETVSGQYGRNGIWYRTRSGFFVPQVHLAPLVDEPVPAVPPCFPEEQPQPQPPGPPCEVYLGGDGPKDYDQLLKQCPPGADVYFTVDYEGIQEICDALDPVQLLIAAADADAKTAGKHAKPSEQGRWFVRWMGRVAKLNPVSAGVEATCLIDQVTAPDRNEVTLLAPGPLFQP